MAQSNVNTTSDELRDKIKFEVLVPFATYIDPMTKASLLFEDGKVVNTENVYKNAIDKIEALIKQHELELLDRLEPLTHEGRGTIAWEMDDMLSAIKAERERLGKS